MYNNNKPLITLCLLAFNQEEFIEDAVNSALMQTYPYLEILISDDCSSDRTFEIIEELIKEYNGQHKVILNKNSKNLNIGGHLNTISKIASGDLIVFAAGDDISLPYRVEKLVNRWFELRMPSIVMHSNYTPINEYSEEIITCHLQELNHEDFKLEDMASGTFRILGATTAITKDLFASFPPLEAGVIHEDRVFPFRVKLLDGIVEYHDEKLVRYRLGTGISTDKPKSAYQQLYSNMPLHMQRIIPDALQRLIDLDLKKPTNVKLKTLCHTTISNHQAMNDLALGSGLYLDIKFIKWLLVGAKFSLLVKVYLKLRFFWIYKYYFEYVQKK